MSSYFKSNSAGICINEVLYTLYGFPRYKAIVKSSFVIDPNQSACCVLRLAVKSVLFKRNSRLKNCSSLSFLFNIVQNNGPKIKSFFTNSKVSN
jgi:hypothetical protein